MDFTALFGKPAAQPAAAPPPAPAQTVQTGTPGSTPVPANTQPGAGIQNPQNPLDSYTALYENANKASPDKPLSLALDSKVVKDVANTMQFTTGFDPAVLTAAMGGNQEAFLQVMNQVGRNAYEQALVHGTTVTGKYLDLAAPQQAKHVGELVRTNLVNASVADDGMFSHPVMQQEFNRMATMIAAANPEASPHSIAAQTKAYFTNLAQAMGMQPNTPGLKEAVSESGNPESFDFLKFLGKEAS